jgi:hypothetical protein
MHKPGQVHRLGKFGPAVESAGYKRIAETAVMLDAAFGKIDRESIKTADWT